MLAMHLHPLDDVWRTQQATFARLSNGTACPNQNVPQHLPSTCEHCVLDLYEDPLGLPTSQKGNFTAHQNTFIFEVSSC